MANPEAELKTLETKVVILGHTGVGKTSMLNQFVRGQFTPNTTATIGAAFMRKSITINNWTIVLQIWDTAGQERFRSMAPMYYRGAHAAVLVFDVTSADTLDKVSGWVEELQTHANQDIVLVLAANKCDLREALTNQPVVAQQSYVQYAKSINASQFETSAKTGKGIDDLFQHVAQNLLKAHLSREEARAKQKAAAQGSANVTLDGNTQQKPSGGCC